MWSKLRSCKFQEISHIYVNLWKNLILQWIQYYDTLQSVVDIYNLLPVLKLTLNFEMFIYKEKLIQTKFKIINYYFIYMRSSGGEF